MTVLAAYAGSTYLVISFDSAAVAVDSVVQFGKFFSRNF
jgi:hypothetical protein